VQDALLPTDQQAEPWKDFVPVDATVDMVEGVTRVPIQITILPVGLDQSSGVGFCKTYLLTNQQTFCNSVYKLSYKKHFQQEQHSITFF